MVVVEKFKRRADTVNSLLCVGLDSAMARLPERFLTAPYPQFAFNRWIIEGTHPYVSAYKPNIAFYEAHGSQGLSELKMTMDYLLAEHPDILTICDAKRGDNGTTNEGYVTAIFDWLNFDAVTLHPYMGRKSLSPFLEREDKACIILCRTSNPGDGELEDLLLDDGRRLWEAVATNVATGWNTHGNCMLVVGATRPDELGQIRNLVGDMTFLVPGVGGQGGSIQQAVRNGLNSDGKGLIVSASRSVIYAEDPADEARILRDEINRYRP